MSLTKNLALVAVAGLTLPLGTAWAQTTVQPAPVQPASASSPMQLSSGAQQVLQLSQAKISDDTIIAFIKGSSINYNLSANEIIYLRQQGISAPVISAMLNQAGGAAAPAASGSASVPTVSTDSLPVYTAPATTVVETTPQTVYYYDDPYYGPYYYPGYYPVGVYIGGGWGYHGGYYGGYHGGGGWHGGGGYHGGWHH